MHLVTYNDMTVSDTRGRARKNNNGTISRPFHTIIHRLKPLFAATPTCLPKDNLLLTSEARYVNIL